MPHRNTAPSDERLFDHEPFVKALNRLRKAHEAAQRLHTSPWKFAVQMDELALVGLDHTDIRVLISHGYMKCRDLEAAGTRGRATRLRFPRLTPTCCFVITPEGMDSLGQQRLNIDVAVHDVPCWDGRRLTLGRLVLKEFRQPARNQRLLFEAFQEQQWRTPIDDPLPLSVQVDRLSRLHATIKAANHNQSPQLIRFFGDGTGFHVGWALRMPSSPVARH